MDERKRPTFYRNLFAGLCFFFLAVGLWAGSVKAFWACMVCGAFSRTAMKKQWADPPYAESVRRRLRALVAAFHREGGPS
ncbi:MAG: hypothetical protein PHF19_05065 [Synergistales bacterium]|nr:hypothetical protein [Synergistales bacterium]